MALHEAWQRLQAQLSEDGLRVPTSRHPPPLLELQA